VETYLQRYPELGEDPEILLALIGREFQLRRQQSDLTADEYVQRFPERAVQVKEHLARDATPPGVGSGPLPPRGLRYRPLRVPARGGVGEVFVAEDQELGREVALKGIQEVCLHDPDSRRRFLREAEITGRLEHPGIVPVYGLGQDAEGRPFYAMRFIKGETL